MTAEWFPGRSRPPLAVRYGTAARLAANFRDHPSDPCRIDPEHERLAEAAPGEWNREVPATVVVPQAWPSQVERNEGMREDIER
jgi:hypothetical protein